MKFLCVRCDAAMKLEQVERPDGGSLSVVFGCAACGNRVAMLTNPWETQLVRALDVRIGEPSSRAEPLAFVRRMLASEREPGRDASTPTGAANEATPTSGCPFSAMANLAAAEMPSAEYVAPGSGHQALGTQEIAWAPEAECRLERVPDFIRPMVRRGIEQFAAARGQLRITERVMDEARGALGM